MLLINYLFLKTLEIINIQPILPTISQKKLKQILPVNYLFLKVSEIINNSNYKNNNKDNISFYFSLAQLQKKNSLIKSSKNIINY